MARYEIRDLPADVWTKANARAERERVPLHVVIAQLLADYGAGLISPSSGTPADPWMTKYGDDLAPFFSMASVAEEAWPRLSDRERGAKVRDLVELSARARDRGRFPSDFDFTLAAKRFRALEKK